MKNTIVYCCLLLLFTSCVSKKLPINDISCLRRINTQIENELKKTMGKKYDENKEQIELVMKFYVKESGRVDSIVTMKSNLPKFNVSNTFLIEKLLQNKYKCLRDVYYKGELKPDNVTIIFNPKLCY